MHNPISRSFTNALLKISLVFAVLIFVGPAVPAETDAAASRFIGGNERLLPLPVVMNLDKRKVALGKTLFHDKRMSRDGKLSCAYCHDFFAGGSDSKPFSKGIDGIVGETNSMSIFNLAFQSVLNWDGRNTSLTEQFEKTVPNNKLLGGSWNALIEQVGQDDTLAAQFRAIYRDGVTKKNYIDAATTYIRSLATPSRFDRFLRGDASALTDDEKQGYREFMSAGCARCHFGVAIGGNKLERLGIAEDYFKARQEKGFPLKDADRGRFNVSKNVEDMHVFKVPSLRNVALTAPYFHDASVQTLDEAVEVMFRFQLGRRTTANDRARIVKFLESLNAEKPPTHE